MLARSLNAVLWFSMKSTGAVAVAWSIVAGKLIDKESFQECR
jgi:hypothetical protein